MRQQLTNVSANNEQLLTAHHEERTRLEGQIERMRQANKVSKHKALIKYMYLMEYCLVFYRY